MKAMTLVAAIMLVGAVVLVGCEKPEPTPGGSTAVKKLGKCPGCGMEAPIGTYCKKCNAVAAEPGVMVHCDKCNKDMKAGTFCKMCNKFVMPEKEVAAPDGKPGKWGEWCERCDVYLGVTGYEK